ncbi:RND transporter MFP subunit, partial [Shinella sp. GWS1]
PAVSGRRHRGRLLLRPVAGFYSAVDTTIAALRPGLRGEAVLDGFPDHPFPVTVLRLAPVASAEKGTLTLRLTLAGPPEGIRPNMAARIRITLDETGDKTQ